MAQDQQVGASWDGADGSPTLPIESCTYTCGHGPSPGVAICVSVPRPDSSPPAEFGTLTITDGIKSIPLRDCRLTGFKGEMGPQGQTWRLEISDRRWRWAMGRIDGVYNQTDPHGKYIPWTVQSPTELANLLLDAANEKGATVDLPEGVTSDDTAKYTEFLRVGETIISGTNPPITWTVDLPMFVLARLAEQFGCRMAYQPIADTVVIGTPAADGSPSLPEGPIIQDDPATKPPLSPQGYGIVGSPTRFEIRLLLEPVGQDWDTQWKHIDLLSYAPLGSAKPQISTVTLANWVGGQTLTIVVTTTDDEDNVVPNSFSYTTLLGAGADLILFAEQITAGLSPGITATSSGSALTLTGQPGESFDVVSFTDSSSNPAMTLTDALVQAAADAAPSWANEGPGGWPSVRNSVVDGEFRLGKKQCQQLAEQYVWKAYRVVNVNVNGNGKAIKVPGYDGRIDRIQQLIISESMVQQITPNQGDQSIIDPVTNQPYVHEWYDGYATSKRAACFGSVASLTQRVGWQPEMLLVGPGADAGGNAKTNTPVGAQVFTRFQTIPEYNIIIFNERVWKWGPGGTYVDPGLALQCACLVRDADTNALVRYESTRGDTSDPSQVYWQMKPDVQQNFIGDYDDRNNLLGVDTLDADPDNRSSYYLDGLEANLLPNNGETRRYVGIIDVDPDPAIWQVTWNVGPQGADTIASLNWQHDTYIAPYAVQRFRENLSANPAGPGWIVDGARPPNLGSSLVGGNREGDMR